MNNNNEKAECDFITMLSSDLIAQVMEEYFNKKLFKQQVEVVDLKPNPSGDGYAFSLAFKKSKISNEPVLVSPHGIYTSNGTIAKVRDKKGQFIKEKV